MSRLNGASTAAGAVSVNDNTRPAGRLEENVLTVRLYADVGSCATCRTARCAH